MPRSAWIRNTLKLLASLVVLAWLGFFSLDWKSIAAALGTLPLATLPTLMLIQIILRFAWSGHGWLVFKISRLPLGYWDIFSAQSLASFAALVLPGEIVSGVVSWKCLAREGRDGVRIACLLLAVRLMLLASLAPLMLLVFLDPKALHSILPTTSWSILLFSALACSLLFAFHRNASIESLQLDETSPSKKHSVLYRIFDSALQMATIPPMWKAILLAAGLLIHLMVACSLMVVFEFAGVRLSPGMAFVAVVAINFIQIMPFVLSGLGVRELTVAALLDSLYGIHQETTLVAMLAAYVASLAVTVLIGLFTLFYQRRGAHPRSDTTHSSSS